MFILLKATDKYKGILIITHNEQWYDWSFIKCKYYIILHLNWDISILRRSSYIDYYMIPKSEVKCDKDLGYDCTNFISKCFNPFENIVNVNEQILELKSKYNMSINFTRSLDKKQYDFIYNGRCEPFKETLEICKYFAYLADMNISSVMIILHLCHELDNYYENVVSYYNSLPEKVKKLFNLIDTSKLSIINPKFHGLNLDEVALFCKTSSIYIHGSEEEGTSRSMHEAVCSGCLIMAKDSMKGGALSYLSEENSVLYNKQNFNEKYQEALNKMNNYNCSVNNICRLSEIYMFPEMINDLYKKLNYSEFLSIDDFSILLDKSVPQLNWAAHNNQVPWNNNSIVSHIKTLEQVKLFLEYLLN